MASAYKMAVCHKSVISPPSAPISLYWKVDEESIYSICWQHDLNALAVT